MPTAAVTTMDDSGIETHDDAEERVPEEAAGDAGDATADTTPPRAERHGLSGGAWAGIVVGVVVLVVAAGLVGYLVGRGSGSDDGEAAVTGDTARTDQKVCAALVAAQQEIVASDSPSPAVIPAALRRHVAGVLSDAPDSAVTAAVGDAYTAAGTLEEGGDPALAAYAEKLAIAKYQCSKIATWDWPAT